MIVSKEIFYKSLFLLLIIFPVNLSAQKKIERKLNLVNNFNRLFNNDFIVNPSTFEITPRTSTGPNIKTYYDDIKKYFNNDYQTNLENTSIKNPCPSVFTYNLVLSEENVFYSYLNDHIPPSTPVHVADSTLSLEEYQDKLKRKAIKQFQKRINDSIRDLAYEYGVDFSYEEQVSTINEDNINSSVKQLADLVKSKHITKIYFFIHGYNVPHSLAQLQGNEMIRLINNGSTLKDKILFIRVFWDSNSRKKFDLALSQKKSGFYLKNLTYRDKKTIKNATKFGPTLRRGKDCAIYFRKFLNKLSQNNITNKVEYAAITHSLGALVMTNSLINTPHQLHKPKKKTKKLLLQYNFTDTLSKASVAEITSKMRNLGEKEKTVRQIESMFREPLPELKFKIFMNAPAISAQTFKYINVNKPYYFAVGFNRNDPVLSKRFALRKVKYNPMFPGFVCKTSLGFNYRNDCEKVLFIYDEKMPMENIKNKFQGFSSSTYFHHDIFYYYQHALFQFYFTKFIKH